MASASIPLVDVLIIGGGPAGLATATGLVRQLQTAIVFNSSKFRNERATGMYNVAGFDHVPPSEFRAKARKDILARYDTVQFRDVEIKTIAKTADGRFEAIDASGAKYMGKKVVLGTGVRDLVPDIPGAEERWGRGM
jgi:gliotoxin/aspirochlorine biosynthesis thioredoxin reductase